MDAHSPSYASAIAAILVVSMATVSYGMLPCYEEPGHVDKVTGCLNPLKTALTASKPSDINAFLCSAAHKEGMDCVIKELNLCPGLLTENVIAEFTSGEFVLSDLAKVSSADNFCECAPTLQCLDGIELDMLTVVDAESTFKTIHNIQYTCSEAAKPKRECVLRALPDCKTYLQAKRDKFTEDMYQAVLSTPDIAAEHCSKVMPTYVNGSKCIMRRARTEGLQRCVEGANLYKTKEDRGCGLYRCVEMLMKTCPEGWMEFYIDTVNVYLEEKITIDETCPEISAASYVIASFSLLFVSAIFVRI